MTNLNSKLLGGAAVALLAGMLAAPAQAQTVPLYAGGATLPERVYRDIFNCYGDTSGGELEANLPASGATCNGNPAYRSNVAALYVGVGSGNGLRGFQTHNAVQFTLPTGASARTPDNPPVPSTTNYGTFYGAGVGAGWVPNSAGPAFPTVSFVGSDDPLTTTNINTYNTNNGANNWGAPIQLPSLVTTIAVAFSPAAGIWTEKGKDLKTTGASSKVQFSTNTLCGIFTGAINTWNHAEITADNAGVQLGTGTINVVYRGDGSGTTFLFSNGLIHQCGTVSSPRAGITHPVPDNWLSSGGNNISNPGNPDNIGNSNNNFFINVNTAGLKPANFTAASGNAGVQAAIAATAGSVGYLSPDFTKNGVWNAGLQQVVPFDSSVNAPKTANLQTWYSFVTPGVLKKFVAAGPKSGTAIMAKALPPSFTAASCPIGTGVGQSPDGKCAHNALNWGAINPLPIAAAAYPIGGFTFINTYTCFSTAAKVSALVDTTAGSLGLLRWYFGSATDNAGEVKNSLTKNGFSLVPGAWISAAKKLLTTDIATKVGIPGQIKTGCSTLPASGGA